MASQLNLVFICTYNAGRSQMAEAFARDLGRGRLEAASVGTEPAAALNFKTLQVMGEVGFDLARHYAKGFHGRISDGDYYVVMGTDVVIPEAWGGLQPCETWAIPNPKGMPLEMFRIIRDQIQEHVTDLLRRLLDTRGLSINRRTVHAFYQSESSGETDGRAETKDCGRVLGNIA
jgi:arsenate reductase